MSELIDVNVTGRLMVLLTRHGILDRRSLAIYRRAVSEAVQFLAESRGAEIKVCDRCIEEQLGFLNEALRAHGRRSGIAGHVAGDVAGIDGSSSTGPQPRKASATNPESEPPVDPALAPGQENAHAESAVSTTESPIESGEDVEAMSKMRKALRDKRPSGYVPPAKSMEEKLSEARKPIQALLAEDCVHLGLLTSKQAKKLILGMTGKSSQQAEQEIVEHLRQVLQMQVKSFIRKSKGGPWGDPRTQEDLRKDIHAARNIRSVLMLARQVIKEYQAWQGENGRGGILGLFTPRKRIVQG